MKRKRSSKHHNDPQKRIKSQPESQPSESPLQALPNEMLLKIRNHLVDVKDVRSLSHACQKMHSLFQRDVRVATLLDAVVTGNIKRLETLLLGNASLLTSPDGQATDYAGRKFKRLSPIQAAFCVGDEQMCSLVIDVYLKHFPEKKATLARQLHEIFPEEYAAHVIKQQAIAQAFKLNYIDPLVLAITNAQTSEVERALQKNKDNSELCRLLNAFKTAFTELALHEKTFNPYPLLSALKIHEEKYHAWYVNDDNPARWLRLDLFWRQVIGWIQRYLSANLAQAFCTGINKIVTLDNPLQRSLQVSQIGKGDFHFFPSKDPLSGLGYDAAITNYFDTPSDGAVALNGWRPWAQCVSRLLEILLSNKQTQLQALYDGTQMAVHRHATPNRME